MQRFYKKWFIPLVIPAVILFVIVIFIPFFVGVLYSFTAWRGTYFAVNGTNTQNPFEAFVGFSNYINAFQSEKFVDSLIYTVKYTVVATIWINLVGLGLALLVNKVVKTAGVFRTIFFMPNLLGGLALGFIWSFIFEIVYSQILFGEDCLISIPFLTNMTQDNTKALFALVILVSWQMGGYMMLIFVNGLNNIPQDLYEAATIDGASPFRVFKSITIPMLMPAFTITFFLTLAYSFKLLDQNVALTDGNFGTRMLAMQILKTTSDSSPSDYGLAQAEAVIFFVLVAGITLFQVYMTKKREVEA